MGGGVLGHELQVLSIQPDGLIERAGVRSNDGQVEDGRREVGIAGERETVLGLRLDGMALRLLYRADVVQANLALRLVLEAVVVERGGPVQLAGGLRLQARLQGVVRELGIGLGAARDEADGKERGHRGKPEHARCG